MQREYYVNDNGRQMDILALCVWLRYLELCGESPHFPENGYRGEYIYDIRPPRSVQRMETSGVSPAWKLKTACRFRWRRVATGKSTSMR